MCVCVCLYVFVRVFVCVFVCSQVVHQVASSWDAGEGGQNAVRCIALTALTIIWKWLIETRDWEQMQIQRLSKVIISMISFTFGGLGLFSLWLIGWDIHSAPLPFSHCKEAWYVALQVHYKCTVIHLLSTWGELYCTRMHWKYWHYCFALECSGMLKDALRYFTMHCAAADCTGMQWRKSASSTFSAKAQHPLPSGKQSVEKRNLTDDSFQVCIARLLCRQMSFKHRLRALSGWRGGGWWL